MSGLDGGGLSAEEREALDEALWGGRIYDDVPALVASIVADRDARVAAAEQRADRVTAAVEALAGEMSAAAYLTLRSALADPAPREYDDGGPRVREAVERAERDAEVDEFPGRCQAVDPKWGRCTRDAHDDGLHGHEGVPGPPPPPQRWQARAARAERDAEVAARAWEEGAFAGREYQKRLLSEWSRIGPTPMHAPNPYRATATEGGDQP